MKILLKTGIVIIIVAIAIVGLASAAAAAGPPDKVDGFVCPVLGGQAGQNGVATGISPIAGGYFTVGGPNVSVPAQTTNTGFPSVAGSFLTPGDPGYGAIWDFANAPGLHSP